MKSLGICLAIFLITGSDSGLLDGRTGHINRIKSKISNINSKLRPPWQTQRPPDYGILTNTLGQFDPRPSQWFCSNLEYGDTVFRINTNGFRTDSYPIGNQDYPLWPDYPNHEYPQPQNPKPKLPKKPEQKLPEDPKPQLPKKPLQKEEKGHDKDTGFPKFPWTVLNKETSITEANDQKPTADPFKNFDWTSYLTTSPATIISERDRDGVGNIDPRTERRS